MVSTTTSPRSGGSTISGRPKLKQAAEIQQFRTYILTKEEALTPEELTLGRRFMEPDAPDNIQYAAPPSDREQCYTAHLTIGAVEGLSRSRPCYVVVSVAKQPSLSSSSSGSLSSSSTSLPSSPRDGGAAEIPASPPKSAAAQHAASQMTSRQRALLPVWNETVVLPVAKGCQIAVELQMERHTRVASVGRAAITLPFDRADDPALSWCEEWVPLHKADAKGPSKLRLSYRVWLGLARSRQFGRKNMVEEPEKKPPLVAATPFKLIQALTEIGPGGYPSRDRSSYLSTFLLTFRAVLQPQALLNLLRVRFFQPEPEHFDELPVAEQGRWLEETFPQIQLHTVNFLRLWIDQYPADFHDDPGLRERMEALAQRVNSANPRLGKILLCSLERLQKHGARASPLDPSRYMNPSFTRAADQPFDWKAVPIADMARQITLMNADYWSKLRPWEFHGQPWAKQSTRARCPNINALELHYEQLGLWVHHEILYTADLKERAIVLQRMIVIAYELRHLNNYHASFAIYCVLVSSPDLSPTRLWNTWELIPSKIMGLKEEMDVLFDPSSNFSSLRHALANTSPPVVPLIPIYLKDFTFVEDGNPNFHPTYPSMIQFSKLELLANLLKDVQMFQQPTYDFTPLYYVQDYLRSFQFNPDDKKDKFHQQSLHVCPRRQQTN